MKKHQLTSMLALGISALSVHQARGQIFRIDMDANTPAMDTVISKPVGSLVTVGVYLDLTGGGAGYPPGMSIYGVSLVFDNTELTLVGAPAATQSIPTLLPFGFGTLGVPTELAVDFAYDAGGTWGSIKSFAGFTLAAGPVSGLHLLGTVNFTVIATKDDGLLDLIPGFFNVGIDGLYDNASGLIAMGPANFVGGESLTPLYITSVGKTGNNLSLSWLAQSNVTYRVQYKTNLDAAISWTDVSGDVTATNATASKTDVVPAGAPQRFYRVEVVQ